MNYNLKRLIDNVEKDKGTMLNDLIDMGIVSLEALIREVVSMRDARKIHRLQLLLKAHNFPLEVIVEEVIATNNIRFITDVTSLMNFLGHKELVNKLSLVILESNDVFAKIHIAKTIPGVSIPTVFHQVLISGNLNAIASLLKQVDFNKENKKKLAFDIYVEENVEQLLEVILKPENIDFIIQTKEDLHDLTLVSYFNQFIVDFGKTLIGETDLFASLLELYQKRDFDTIRKYKDVFSSLFQDDEEIRRK